MHLTFSIYIYLFFYLNNLFWSYLIKMIVFRLRKHQFKLFPSKYIDIEMYIEMDTVWITDSDKVGASKVICVRDPIMGINVCRQ